MGADWDNLRSPETYVGHQKAANFASPGGAAVNTPRTYRLPARLRLNQWALSGDWTVKPEAAVLNVAGGRIAYRFRARDVHLIQGPAARGRSVRFRVFIDGQPAGSARGTDVDDRGRGQCGRATPLSARSAKGTHRRATVRDRVSRSRSRSVRVHVRVIGDRQPQGSYFFGDAPRAAELAATADRINALKAASLSFSPSRKSMARRVFPSRLELNNFLGSGREAPRKKVSFTTCLYDSPVQTPPSMRPHRSPWGGGLRPFPFFFDLGVRIVDELTKAGKRLAPPVPQLLNPLRDVLRRGRAVRGAFMISPSLRPHALSRRRFRHSAPILASSAVSTPSARTRRPHATFVEVRISLKRRRAPRFELRSALKDADDLSACRPQALAAVACRRRQKKYESPQSTPVAAAQPHTSGPSPIEKWARSAEPSVMAKPA